MPFIAVLYVPSNDSLEALMIRQKQSSSRLVGVYPFPAKGDAECPGVSCGGQKLFGWGRHREHGYLVHGECQKRRRGFRNRIKVSLLDLFGYNLLPMEETPALFRNPHAADHPNAYPSI